MTMHRSVKFAFLVIAVGAISALIGFKAVVVMSRGAVMTGDVLSDTPSAQGKDGECLGLDLQWAPCEVTPIECRDPDALSTAVLSKLYSRVPETHYALQSETTEAAILKAAQEIARLEKWAATIEPECVRVQYEHWLEYYEGQLSEELTRLRSGERQREESSYQKYVREQEEREKRADALKSRLPDPPSALDMTSEKEMP